MSALDSSFEWKYRSNLYFTAFQVCAILFVRTHWDTLQMMLNLFVEHHFLTGQDIAIAVQLLEATANIF